MDEIRQAQLVDEEEIANYQEIEIRTMSWQQHDRHRAFPLNPAKLLQHFFVNIYAVVEALEKLVQQPGHRPHHWHSHFPNQTVDYRLRLQTRFLDGSVSAGLIALGSFVGLCLDGLDDSSGGQNFRLHLSDDALALNGQFSLPGPLDV